ncbi:ABC transporter permease [Numidum massiliense]|uniref:ABC transporter permease n=1 Tax=Numidum massiliense TaxID=1522315 RepID=UPI0006D57840|nr:ABC transporter permease [Numidum massiliense]
MRMTFRIFSNHVLRMWNRRNVIVITLLMTMAAVAFAVFFTSQIELKGNVAVVASTTASLPLDEKNYSVHYLEQAPLQSELVRNKYDAVVTLERDGSYQIETLKTDRFKEELEQAIAGSDSAVPTKKKRSLQNSILGFLSMLLLVQALFYFQLFSDDKKTGTLRRTAVSPAGIAPYLIAQCLFGFLGVYAPAWLVLAITKGIGLDIGFSLGMYALLLIFPALLAVSFALFIAAWIENADTGLSLASGIIIISSLLSGSFYKIDHQNGVMEAISNVLPQKQFILLVDGVEAHGTLLQNMGNGLYVIAVSLALGVAGWFICRHRLYKGWYG